MITQNKHDIEEKTIQQLIEEVEYTMEEQADLNLSLCARKQK